MKKSLLLIAIISFTFFTVLTGCNNKSYSNYQNEEGYSEYISDRSTGYDDATYYFCEDSISNNEKAREYYQSNMRQAGDYIITNYEDGICINRYTGKQIYNIEIPETIDGLSVVKLGAYIDENTSEIKGAFSGCQTCTVQIPSTLKYISSTFYNYITGTVSDEERKNNIYVQEINVSHDNPYYASLDGSLYTKDMKSLLFLSTNTVGMYNNSFTIPDSVICFEPSNGVDSNINSLEFGESVKTINTYVDKGENAYDYTPYLMIYGYKETVAEDWAKEQYAEFIAID